jgi:predicted chitinase
VSELGYEGKLGNEPTGDGALFRGRGFVQPTRRDLAAARNINGGTHSLDRFADSFKRPETKWPAIAARPLPKRRGDQAIPAGVPKTGLILN